MAGAIHTTKPQKLTPVVVEKNQLEDPNKFYYHFLYKASIVLIFFVILPLFPSQAPDFINQSLLTRNWELLHLLFVGIAISYGLFSRRNDETDKDNNNNSKFDSAQSLVSRFLQVSSFFDDESEKPTESEETKIQTWSHQHYRNKPVVVLAPQAQSQSQAHHNDFEDHVTGESETEKPLLLPVRSLKSRLSDDVVQSVNGAPSCTRSFSLDRSTCSKRFSSNNNSNKARNAEIEGSRLEDKIKEKEKENVVLPSPIPWRSRSARMEQPKLEIDNNNNNNNNSFHQQASKTSLMEESRPLKSQSQSQSQTYSRSSSRTSSVSSSPLVSSESVAKNAEDLIKKKSFYYKSCCPPPPPPPPPTMFHKSISMKPPRYGSFNEGGGANSFDKELKRSFTSERNSRNRNYAENVSMGKCFKPGQNLGSFSGGREIGGEGMNAESQVEDEEEHASFPLVSGEEEQESFLDKLTVESEDEETETEDEDGGEGRMNIIQKESGESRPPHVEESSKTEIGASSSGTVGDEIEGPDVDKKADEFIAKFREQIRLQRIESIKRSTTRVARNSSR